MATTSEYEQHQRDMAEMVAKHRADPVYHGLGESFDRYLQEHGIVPQRVTEESYSCCIGFSEREQKWAGWSHRGVARFGIGDTVKRGDCAYQPTDPNDFLEDMRRFWDDSERHERTWAEHAEHNGLQGVMVRWKYNDSAPNKDLHGTTDKSFAPYPATWGRGEWTAQTLDDAKQMAIDYSEGVS
jgi:hypothetical protein